MLLFVVYESYSFDEESSVLVNVYDEDPFIAACRSGNLEAVKYFVNVKKPKPKPISIYESKLKPGVYFTALYVAVQQGHLEVVKFLVKKGWDVNKGRVDGITPLDVAVDKKRYEVVDYLLSLKKLKKNGDRTVNKPNSLMRGILLYDFEMVEKLADKGASFKVKRNGTTAEALVLSQLKMLESLPALYCRRGRSLGCVSGTPVEPVMNESAFFYASKEISNPYGESELTAVLREGNLGAFCKEYRKNPKIIDEPILSLKFDPPRMFPPIYMAAQNNHVEMVEFLISAGCNVNQVSGAGYSALYRAAELGNVEVVELLVNVPTIQLDGPWLPSQNRDTPLVRALIKGHYDVAGILLRAGASPWIERNISFGDGIIKSRVATLKKIKGRYLDSQEGVQPSRAGAAPVQELSHGVDQLLVPAMKRLSISK